MKFSIFILSIFLFSSFQCSEKEGVKKESELIIKKGQTQQIEGSNYSISLDSVINDSRCAIEVECIWAGDAIAEFKLLSGNRFEPFELHSNQSLTNDTTINEIKIDLLDITPYPSTQNPINKDNYEAKVRITAIVM